MAEAETVAVGSAHVNGEDPEIGRAYRHLFGEIPPHAQTRFEIVRTAGRGDTVPLIERLRNRIICESPLEPKEHQKIQFGMLLVLRDEGPARLHANAARRHGATVEELASVAEFAYLTGGISAFSLGVKIVGEMLDE